MKLLKLDMFCLKRIAMCWSMHLVCEAASYVFLKLLKLDLLWLKRIAMYWSMHLVCEVASYVFLPGTSCL